MEKLPPERSAKGEESLPKDDEKVENFKSLAKRILKVKKEEIDQVSGFDEAQELDL